VQLIILDGPQAWKSPDNGLIFARKCEADLATQGKTGLPGHCTPSTYLRFIQFSISVFDELADRGWPRLASAETGPAENLALESFPTAAWRALGLSPLPGKRSATAEVVHLKQTELELLFSFRVGTPLSHDEVQALVAGFAGLAVAASLHHAYQLVGLAPLRLEETWREGFIVNPLRGIGAAVLSNARTTEFFGDLLGSDVTRLSMATVRIGALMPTTAFARWTVADRAKKRVNAVSSRSATICG
jgi:hypothetical protein